MSQSIYGNHRSSYIIRTPSALRGCQTLTVESRSRDGGSSASDFTVNLSVPIQCATNQAIGYYLKEAHLPIANWTVSTGYDSFQIAFPYAITSGTIPDNRIYKVDLKHGSYNAGDFAAMVENALNIATFDNVDNFYKLHVHEWPDHDLADNEDLKDLVEADIDNYNTNNKQPSAQAAELKADGSIESPISFSVKYNVSKNRFSISRTDPGRFFKTGQYDIAIENYQLAKSFGCPWSSKFNTSAISLVGGHPT